MNTTELEQQEQIDARQTVQKLFERYDYQGVANYIFYLKLYAKEEIKRKQSELESNLSTIGEILENI